MAKMRWETDGKHLQDLQGDRDRDGGTERRTGKHSGKREDVFDTEHHVPPGCSLTLTSMMPGRVSKARRAAVLRRQPEMRFRTESVHVGKEGVLNKCICCPAAADSV